MTGERRSPGGGAAQRAYLRSEDGHRIDLLPNRVYVLGRSDTCDVQIDDQNCSRRHARLSVSGDARAVHAEDLTSKNGTFVNEKRLKHRTQLGDGDRLRLGATTFVVSLWTEAAEVPLDTRTNLLGK